LTHRLNEQKSHPVLADKRQELLKVSLFGAQTLTEASCVLRSGNFSEEIIVNKEF
jgi:hypothetical protein